MPFPWEHYLNDFGYVIRIILYILVLYIKVVLIVVLQLHDTKNYNNITSNYYP